MAKIKEEKLYSNWEQLCYYVKRFLKVAIPLAVVTLPLAAQAAIDWSTLGYMALVPLLTTLDKYARDRGWYKY